MSNERMTDAALAICSNGITDAERMLKELRELCDRSINAGGERYILPNTDRYLLIWAMDAITTADAALRARPQAVAEVENYSADLTAARDFRITASPDLSDYVLQWQIMDGTIMTVTSIKISREGLLHTLGVIDRVRELLPLAASQSATGGA